MSRVKKNSLPVTHQPMLLRAPLDPVMTLGSVIAVTAGVPRAGLTLSVEETCSWYSENVH